MTNYINRNLEKLVASWSNRDPVPAIPSMSEIDNAWKRLDDLLESTYKDAENTHDGMVYFERISDIQTAVADLKRLINEDEGE